MRLTVKVGVALLTVPICGVGVAVGCGSDDPEAMPTVDPDAGDAGGFADGAWEYKTYECPPNGAEGTAFPPGEDRWSPLIGLEQKRKGLHIPPIHIALLPNGRVLMPGANMRATPDAGVINSTSNFILTPDEPTEEQHLDLQEIGSPHHGGALESLFCAGHAPMEDGRLFFSGGNREGQYCPDGGINGQACVDALQGLDYGHTFDPSTESFTLTEYNKGGKRWYPTVTRLADGRMLIVAGDVAAELVKNHSAEVFDPATGQHTMLSDEANTPKEVEITSHYVHSYLLPKPITAENRARDTLVMGEGGHVFLFNTEGAFPGAMSERWSRRAQRPGPSFANVVLAHGATAVMLPIFPRNSGRYNNGSIMVIGGSENEEVEQKAELYDPYQDKWCPAAIPLTIPRFQPAAVQLPDGNVLVVAGTPYPTVYGENLPQRQPQIIDPRTGAVFNGTAWPDPYTRGYHTTTLLLPDGRVIVAGGRTFAGGEPDITTFWDERTDMRYYYPPYFGPIRAGKARPVIGEVQPPTIPHHAPVTVSYTAGPIDSVTLVALGAQTHCFDMNARLIELEFAGGTAESGAITVQGPLDRSTAPPGPYMLFLNHKIDGWSVPSVAKILYVK